MFFSSKQGKIIIIDILKQMKVFNGKPPNGATVVLVLRKENTKNGMNKHLSEGLNVQICEGFVVTDPQNGFDCSGGIPSKPPKWGNPQNGFPGSLPVNHNNRKRGILKTDTLMTHDLG